jgi:hypothetical protein
MRGGSSELQGCYLSNRVTRIQTEDIGPGEGKRLHNIYTYEKKVNYT